MFKLVVLSALLAVAASSAIGPVTYTVAETPVIAKVGAVVENVPTAVSHQSSTVVHSRAAVSTPIVAPVVQKTIVASHAPLAYTVPLAYATHGAPLLAKTVVAGSHPVVYEKAIIAGTGPVAYGIPLAYSAPFAYHGVPAVKYVSSPLSYSAPTVVKAW